MIVVGDGVAIVVCFGIRRHTAVLYYGVWSGVVSGDGVGYGIRAPRREPRYLLAKIVAPADYVFKLIVRIYAQRRCGIGHKLHKSDSPDGRRGVYVETAFGFHNRRYEQRVGVAHLRRINNRLRNPINTALVADIVAYVGGNDGIEIGGFGKFTVVTDLEGNKTAVLCAGKSLRQALTAGEGIV